MTKNSLEERITRLLRGKAQGLSFQKIFLDLKLPAKERKGLQKTLHDLADRGILARSRSKFTLSATTRVVRGKFDATLGGYGFVTPEDQSGEDVFIPARYTAGAMEGDTVEVDYGPDGLTFKTAAGAKK